MKMQTMRQGRGDVSVKQTMKEMEYPRVIEFKVQSVKNHFSEMKRDIGMANHEK